MTTVHEIYLLVLTYKRKMLLKRYEDNYAHVNKNTWSFFEDINGTEGTMLKKVAKETNITLSSAELLRSYNNDTIKNNFYHASLTDKHVNEIKRDEGRELQFFTMQEVEKLSLTQASKMLFTQYRSEIEAAFTV